MKIYLALPFIVLAGCDLISLPPSLGGTPPPPPPDVFVTPESLETAAAPPAGAVTVEQFDTTTQEARDAAIAASAPAGDQPLGTTIASLGSPTEPGIWLKTPLVTALTPGRATYRDNTINLELRPSGGEIGSGSQISLAAMRLIDAPLTSLPELTVFAGQT